MLNYTLKKYNMSTWNEFVRMSRGQVAAIRVYVDKISGY